jgi:hypothetical protein
MIRVWWTIPNSAAAWEWRPTKPQLFDATRVVEDDGTQYLNYVEEISGPPKPYVGLPIGQPLADTTALFAQEANLVPTNLIITWIEGRRAARWDRTMNRWTRHAVALREDGPAVSPPVSEPDVPERIMLEAEEYGWSPVMAAGATAMALLGLTPIPTRGDALAQQVQRNQNAIRKSVSTLAERLAVELRHEFPGWSITREESGNWTAIREGTGIVTAGASSELRDKLRHFYNGRT